MMRSMERYKRVARLFVTDRQGRLAIAQWPNVPAWLLIAILSAQMSVPASWHPVLDGAFILFLTYWAWRELQDGISPFRQLLGLIGLLLGARQLLVLLMSH